MDKYAGVDDATVSTLTLQFGKRCAGAARFRAAQVGLLAI
jgi:hypothetical protein